MARLRKGYLALVTLLLGGSLVAAQNRGVAASGFPSSNEIPEGKTALIRLGQRLETRTARPGQRFKAFLAEDLIAPNGNMIPRGSAIRGHISRASEGFHPRLLLSFDRVQSQRGWEPLIASVTGVPGEHGVKGDDDGSIEAASHQSKSSSDSIDEPRSPWSRIGGVAGFFADKSVRLEKGAILEIRLDHAIQLARR
jgi:hypothetical protein